MTAYILQVIVFALAIMGVLFKSTRTDEHGKQIYTSSGLPELTRTGKIVLALLALSFGISVWSIHQKSKADVTAKEQAEAAQKALTKQLNDVTQQNEGLRAQLDKTAQQILEEKVKEISAVIIFHFNGEVLRRQQTAPPPIFGNGVKLEIVGVAPGPSFTQSLPTGWDVNFLLQKPEFTMSASEQSFDTENIPSTAGPYIRQKRVFSNFNAELKDFEKLATWKGAILEAKLVADQTDQWLNALIDSSKSDQEIFDRYYGVTPATRELWSNSDTSVMPIPVLVTLELYINKRKIKTTAEWQGYPAKTTLGDEDVRHICVVKFPVTRVDVQ